jgi:hypothetical protein
MKIDGRFLILGLLVFSAACGEEGPASCSDVDWYPVNPYLTAAPTFTASRIASGDPIALTVSVSDGTSGLSAGIRLVDDPNPDRYPDIRLQEETGGQDVVALSVTTDGLVPGTYLATSISVEEEDRAGSPLTLGSGDYAISSHRSPSPEDVETPYVATYYFGGDGTPYRCQIDFVAPAFEVVDESPSGANAAIETTAESTGNRFDLPVQK